jgi:hypothetical protein
MAIFWMFVDWVASLNEARLLKNCTACSAKTPREWPIAGAFAPEGSLAAKLTVTLEDFDLDCFNWNTFSFVSERMRRAMALGPSDVQYFEVDASRSAPLPRSKNYQVMHVPVTEDVADLENSDYLIRHCADGSLKIGSPNNVVFRPDARPAHELFYDRYFKFIYCSDALAARVLRAGCTGAFFFDASRWSGRANQRIRTRRGVEEIVKWTKRTFRTKLIEAIPEKDPAQSGGET